jgi:hypothetical protein
MEDDGPLETWGSIDRADEREQDIIMPTGYWRIRCGEGGESDNSSTAVELLLIGWASRA